MSTQPTQAKAPAEPPKPDAPSLSDHIGQNVENVVALQKRESEGVSASQLRLERLSRFVGRPLYLVGVLWFVALWISINTAVSYLGIAPVDPAPFPWLEGLLTLVALLTTTVVLIAQNRQTRLAQQRAHLSLQLNMLTEQKVTKVIHLLEELRRDLPMVRDRHDAQAAILQEGASTAQMASVLHGVGLTSDSDNSESNRK